MPPIERRHAIVKLNRGGYAQQLADLLDRVAEAKRAEETAGPRRVGQKSEAIALAKQYDELAAEATASAVEVTVYELSFDHWGDLADAHPPREDEDADRQRGINMKTFPRALTAAAMVAPEDAARVESGTALAALGEGNLSDLKPSRVNYIKLERAAWSVNVEDDALPKASLVSLLLEANDDE